VMALSVEAGHPVECDQCATFADGMAVRVAIPSVIEELRRGYPMMMVSEREIARAVGDYDAAGIRVEGSAAAALAAYRNTGWAHTAGSDEPPFRMPEHDPTVLIVTGRNIDDDLHRRAVEEPESFPD
jgi:threonine dehydratase